MPGVSEAMLHYPARILPIKRLLPFPVSELSMTFAGGVTRSYQKTLNNRPALKAKTSHQAA